jgi:hypothetical protein
VSCWFFVLLCSHMTEYFTNLARIFNGLCSVSLDNCFIDHMTEYSTNLMIF